jgi:hypothetical protein
MVRRSQLACLNAMCREGRSTHPKKDDMVGGG